MVVGPTQTFCPAKTRIPGSAILPSMVTRPSERMRSPSLREHTPASLRYLLMRIPSCAFSICFFSIVILFSKYCIGKVLYLYCKKSLRLTLKSICLLFCQINFIGISGKVSDRISYSFAEGAAVGCVSPSSLVLSLSSSPSSEFSSI